MPTKNSRRVRSSKTSPVAKSSSSSQSPVFSNSVSYLLIVLLMVASFTAGYLFLKLKSTQTGGVANNQVPQQPAAPVELKITKPSTDEHWRGKKDARFVWVEYSDLECPFCKRNHPDVVKLLEEKKDEIGWVYRHYPLPFHPKAQKSAEATECAFEQGGNDAFWSMTDAIFEKMPDMELTQLSEVATEIGLDGATLQQCLDSDKYAQKVKDQNAEGQKAGVNATPTAVIYDMKTGKTKVVEGAVPYDSMKQDYETFVSANK